MQHGKTGVNLYPRRDTEIPALAGSPARQAVQGRRARKNGIAGAGFRSLSNATLVDEADRRNVMSLKENQKELLREAQGHCLMLRRSHVCLWLRASRESRSSPAGLRPKSASTKASSIRTTNR